jgi:hypothetical protein
MKRDYFQAKGFLHQPFNIYSPTAHTLRTFCERRGRNAFQFKAGIP